MDVDPTPAEISAWLATQHRCDATRARTWAEFLAGLPWRYIRPVVTIAINANHGHPALALAGAAKYSSDVEFVATARRHLAACEVPG